MGLLFVWFRFDGRAERGEGRQTDSLQTGRVHEQAFAREAKQSREITQHEVSLSFLQP